jgi:mRNA-degrading endonuclease RelE of RelBE toxin-antitoxin system
MHLTGSTETENTIPPWELDITSTFKRGYKLKDATNRHRVDNIVAELIRSNKPEDFGVPKVTPDGPVLVLEIGRKYRLSYRVNREQHKIDLVRVCDHKTVYGHD